MSVVDRIAARHEAIRAADPVTMEEFGKLLGEASGHQVRSNSGVTVSPDRALGVSAWYRGARWLSETVASLPFRTYRRQGLAGRSRRANPQWADNRNVVMFSILEFLMMSLIHRGNAFFWKVRNPGGQVVSLQPLHPDDVKFGVARGVKVYEIISGNDRIPASEFEVFHVPNLSMNGWFGMDPIRTFANSMGSVIATDEFGQRYFENSASLGAYISMPGALDPDRADELLAEWTRLHRGVGKAHGFGVIGDGATYHQVTVDAEQVQLLESRKFGVTEVARMLGVVPHKLYDLERSTFSNIEHQAIEAITDSIRPYVVRIEAFLKADPHLLIDRNFVELELDGLLRGDIKARYEAYSLAIGGPWLEGNAARRLENYEERPELDVILRPLNMGVAGEEPDTTDADVAAILQKVYLAEREGIISTEEARQIAGVNADATTD